MDTTTVDRSRTFGAAPAPSPVAPPSRTATAPLLAVWTIAAYALVALALLPDGSPTVGGRVTSSVVVLAVAAIFHLAIRREVLGVGALMTVAGSAMLAVAGGVVAPRVLAGITAREILG
ncbi:MAG TPA: hypothetical protein VLA82_05945, partial [Actinomycetota bacterium]|nr:hypothetical protein [Actinomycetota bacterium]